MKLLRTRFSFFFGTERAGVDDEQRRQETALLPLDKQPRQQKNGDTTKKSPFFGKRLTQSLKNDGKYEKNCLVRMPFFFAPTFIQAKKIHTIVPAYAWEHRQKTKMAMEHKNATSCTEVEFVEVFWNLKRFAKSCYEPRSDDSQKRLVTRASRLRLDGSDGNESS